jgi:UDP-glucose:(heptosyl)LPS alpha-1,3-glucosyltransferase
MLKVAIILERAEIGLGGAERSVSELTAELRRKGITATILAAKGTASAETTVLCADYAGKRVPLKVFAAALRAHLNQHPCDIVHSTLPLSDADIYQPRSGSYRQALLQNIASYHSPCRRTLKRWTHRLNLNRSQYLNAEQKVCAPRSKTVVAALSHYVKRQFQTHYALPDHRLAVIPNGIQTPLQPDAAAAGAIKQRILNAVTIPAGKTPVLFLFAANNPRLKGIGPLLESMQRLADDPPAGRYPVLVTAGSKDIRTNLTSVVSLGTLDGIRNALSICDAAVLPTWYDPCSRFILEALAMGKPVITTRFNGAAERYQDQTHGFILDRPDNVDALTAAMRTFCIPGKIELAGKAIVTDNLIEEVSITRHVTALIDLYQKIMAQKETR